MYVEAICPLCFASHVVPEDMRGEKFRCEECEEEFIVSKKAKRTSKKPSRLREAQAAEETAEEVTPVEAAEVAEVLPDAKLADAPPKKKPRAGDEEVLEIPDDALQAGAPVVKTTPASKRRREDDEEEDRPKKRRRVADDDDEDEDDRPRRSPPRRKGVPVALIVGLCAGAAFLVGMCGFGCWFAFSDNPQKPEQAQVNNPPANNPPPKRGENPPPVVNPPRVDPPKENPPPKKERPKKEPPPKVEPPVVWNVKADPPAVTVKMPASFKKEIGAPGVFPEITFPDGPSPFVAVGMNLRPGDERQVWNLQTGEMVGKVVGSVPSNHHPILSPNGAHLAFQSSAKRGTVEIWAPASGKRVSVVIGTTLTPELFTFAGPDQLLIGRRSGVNLTVKVFDAATGKEEREFPTPRPWGGNDALAVSPGGAYLAVVDRADLKVFDVKTGQQVGQRPMPKGPNGASLVCRGLSFSPDGSELAGLFAGIAGMQLTCWDADKGDVVCENSIPKAAPQAGLLAVYRGHVIDWVGDRRGWLVYGYTLVNRGRDGSITALAEPPVVGSPIPRHLVGPGHAVTIVADPKDGKKVLTVSLFDPDKP
jgi:hypothetical protein